MRSKSLSLFSFLADISPFIYFSDIRCTIHPRMRDLHVIIVGAGIGGLQSALALANDGHRVTVFESAKTFEEVSYRSKGILQRQFTDI